MPKLEDSSMGGMPSLRFDGIDDSLTKASVTGSEMFDAELSHIYAVQNFDSTTGGDGSSTLDWWNSITGADRVNVHLG